MTKVYTPTKTTQRHRTPTRHPRAMKTGDNRLIYRDRRLRASDADDTRDGLRLRSATIISTSDISHRRSNIPALILIPHCAFFPGADLCPTTDKQIQDKTSDRCSLSGSSDPHLSYRDHDHRLHTQHTTSIVSSLLGPQHYNTHPETHDQSRHTESPQSGDQ